MGLLNLSYLDNQGSPSFEDRPPLPLVELNGPDIALGFPRGTPVRMWKLGECSVILTHNGYAFGWHLSIAHPRRYPKWDEIAEARYRCMDPGITVAMILPPKGEYINIHKNCFQLHEIPSLEDIGAMVETIRGDATIEPAQADARREMLEAGRE